MVHTLEEVYIQYSLSIFTLITSENSLNETNNKIVKSYSLTFHRNTPHARIGTDLQYVKLSVNRISLEISNFSFNRTKY